MVALGPVAELTDDVLDELVAVNLLAPVPLLRAAQPHLAAPAQRGGPAVVVSISAAGRELRRSRIRLLDSERDLPSSAFTAPGAARP